MHDKGGRQESGRGVVDTGACSHGDQTVSADSRAEHISNSLVESGVDESRDESEEDSDGEEDLTLA